MWTDALLPALAILAGLLFIVGSIQAFKGPRITPPHRRRKPRKRKRVALPPPVEEAPASETPATVLTPASAAPLVAREVAWSGRPPAPVAVAEISDVVQPPPIELDQGKIVVHYADGKILKGFGQDFYPNKPSFHLLPEIAGFSFADEAVEVQMKDLKAVFFVRDFAGNSLYNERKHFLEGEHPSGRKVRVTFRDGEMLVGSTVGYDRQRQGFFLIPADPQSNNRSVFAISAAVTGVRFL